MNALIYVLNPIGGIALCAAKTVCGSLTTETA
jgi:hypothetical protein